MSDIHLPKRCERTSKKICKNISLSYCQLKCGTILRKKKEKNQSTCKVLNKKKRRYFNRNMNVKNVFIHHLILTMIKNGFLLLLHLFFS